MSSEEWLGGAVSRVLRESLPGACRSVGPLGLADAEQRHYHTQRARNSSGPEHTSDSKRASSTSARVDRRSRPRSPSTESDRKLIQSMDSAGAIAGPLAALVLLARFGIRGVFWAAAVPGAPRARAALFGIRETKRPHAFSRCSQAGFLTKDARNGAPEPLLG